MSRKKTAATMPFALKDVRDVMPADPIPIESQASLVITVLMPPTGVARRQMVISVQGDPKFRTNEALGVAETLVSLLHRLDTGTHTNAGAAAAPAGEGGTPCAEPTPSTPG